MIMSMPRLRIFEASYKKYKEIILYLLFGVLTFLIGVLTYAFFELKCGLNELVANIISWLIAVMFAFITNYICVFSARENMTAGFVSQMFRFYLGRLVTLGVEETILALFVTWMQCNSLAVKIVAQIIVIILNYVISKWLIFKK